MDEKKVMLSGIQPSGDLHLGNYLGPLRHWPEMIEEFDCYFFLADLHTITDNIPRRLAAHRAGKGAKYTRGRGPLELVYAEQVPDKSAALRRETAIKRLRRAEKEGLIEGAGPLRTNE